MYQNSANGFEKMAHERIFGDKGRKYVKETQGGNYNTYNKFRGISENQADHFDQEWDR